MTNEIFIARKIDELPKESDWFLLWNKNGGIEPQKGFFNGKTWKNVGPIATHWISKVTIEQLLSEHPEVLTKHILDFGIWYQTQCKGADREKPETDIIQDYINSLKG